MLVRFPMGALASRWLLATLAVVIALTALACGDADEAGDDASTASNPVSLTNCGFEVKVDAAPQRAVTMNQAATEIMLALRLQDRMIGTAYLDDSIPPDYKAAYDKIEVLSDEYPSREALLDKEPDFVYASYASAFGDEEGVGTRESLESLGIDSYVSSAACADKTLRPAKVTFQTVFDEITDIGKLFHVEARATTLVTDLKAQLADASKEAATAKGVKVLWYDSRTEAPTVGSCCGAPGMIVEALGGTNVFQPSAGSWADVSWEEFVASNPGFIVLVDASWDTAKDKRAHLASDPATKGMTAVAGARYGEVPFSASTPGIRNVTAVVELAEALHALPAR